MSGKNTITRSVAPKSVFPSAQAVISSAVSLNQGDLIVFNDTTNLLALAAAETDGATFLGVMAETIVSGKLARPYSTDVDASQAISDIPGPVYGVVAKCVSKTGITWAPGDRAYLDPATGSRGVTNTGTKVVGVYQGAALTTAPAGTEIEVLIGARFADDTLKF